MAGRDSDKYQNPEESVANPPILAPLVFVAMTAILAALADQVTSGAPLTVVDAELSNWLYHNRTTNLTTFFMVVTELGSTVVGSVIPTALGIYLLRHGKKYWFVVSTFTIFSGMLLNRLLKVAFQRARPQFDDPILAFHGYSFPSGHTMTATIVFGTLAVVLLAINRTEARSRWRRNVVLAATALVIGLVAFSRVYLGAHYLSDVLAAIAEGLAWLSLCFTVTYWIWPRRRRSVS